jgi:hypothetical protein
VIASCFRFACGEFFDLCSSNQYILLRVSPSCFRFAKM